MNFLRPAALLAAPLVLAPLVIHLVSLLARRPLPFPYTALLARTAASGRHLKRVHDALLLALRTLALLALVLAFADPVVVLSRGTYPRRILVDLSASMEPNAALIERLAERFRGVSSVTGFALDTLRSLRVTQQTANFDPLAERERGSALVSDFTASQWADAGIAGYTPVVARSDGRDVAVTGLTTKLPFSSNGVRNEATVSLYLYGESTAEVSMSLTAVPSGRVLGERSVPVARDTAVTLPFALVEGESGVKATVLGARSATSVRYAAVPFVPRISVLVAGVGRGMRYVERALEPKNALTPFSVRRSNAVVPADVVVLDTASAPLSPATPALLFPNGDDAGALANAGFSPRELGAGKLTRGPRGRMSVPFTRAYALGGRAVPFLWAGKAVVGARRGKTAAVGVAPEEIALNPRFLPLLYNVLFSLVTAPTTLHTTPGRPPRLPGNARLVSVEGTVAGARTPLTAGVYRALVADSTTALVDCNVDLVEIDRETLDDETLAAASGERPVTLRSLLDDAPKTARPWRLLLIVALAALAVEMALLAPKRPHH